ncbi:diaminopimelate epimerase [soil metagenome]
METLDHHQSQSRSLPFTKMHGLGNDFVMVNEVDLGNALCPAQGQADNFDFAAALSQLARLVCDRHFGIGADGLIVAVRPSRVSEFLGEKLVAAYPSYDKCQLAWIYINSDGSSSDMCGNGLRCLAYFARNNDIVQPNSGWPQTNNFIIGTNAYPVAVSLCDTASTVKGPSRKGSAGGGAKIAAIPVGLQTVRTQLAAPEIKFVAEDLQIGDITLSATSVDMGNPHCVIFDCAELELSQYQDCMHGISSGASATFVEKFPGRLLNLAHQIQSLSVFPQGVNVEFVRPLTRDRAVVYVIERGCGPTLACASGAAAVVAAGVTEARLNRQCCVILPGGELEVTWSSLDNLIELNGPAQIAFFGEFKIDDSFYSSDFQLNHSACDSREELPA